LRVQSTDVAGDPRARPRLDSRSRFLAYTAQTGGLHDVWMTDPGEKPSARPLLNGPASEHSPRFSPDGRWLAYVSDEAGSAGIFVRRFPDGESISVWPSGMGPTWSSSGTEIFFQTLHEGTPYLMSIPIAADGNTLKPGVAKPLFEGRTTVSGTTYMYAGSNNGRVGYDVFPDGQRFVMVRGADSRGAREIVLVQNFFEEAKRLTSQR
jgi:Tol biopolymer transport system component